MYNINCLNTKNYTPLIHTRADLHLCCREINANFTCRLH